MITRKTGIAGLFVFLASVLTDANSTAQTASVVVFEANLQVQADGQPAIESKLTLLPGLTPVILPPSMWNCAVRQSSRNAGVVSREVACWIADKDTQKILTQVGTVAGCDGGNVPVDVGMIYVREGTRLFRIFISCYTKS